MAVAGADHPVHRRAHERKLEAEGVDLPGDVDVLGIAGAPTGDDRDVVEAVRPTTRLADADLDLSHVALLPCCPRKQRSLVPGVRSRRDAPTAGSRAQERLVTDLRICLAMVEFISYAALRPALPTCRTTLPPVTSSTAPRPSMTSCLVMSVAL